ncbi:MAG: 4Fe-4S binding protein [Desulfatitalea sp.]|nr:4Fe-4S binding protein [Desulfatitalea sp.]NNK02295.1 4Fe-4S binding protein [Desulfatitalea sp.]
MLANYGYKDASGDFFITIDTDKCNGCSECVSACPMSCFEVLDEDPNDPLREDPVAIVSPVKKKSLKYECGPCKPTADPSPLPCVQACPRQAVSHSW